MVGMAVGNRGRGMKRVLYLIGYDVADAKRLVKIRQYLTAYRVGGQKSLFECWLTQHEYELILKTLHDFIEPTQDSIFIARLDPRQEIQLYGLAKPFFGHFVMA